MNLANQSFTFELSLIEGIIKNRSNCFIMNVDIDGTVYACHCPATGRIGGIAYKPEGEFISFERFIKHITELAESLRINDRAILLNCFMYDNPRFQIPPRTEHSDAITNAVRKAV